MNQLNRALKPGEFQFRDENSTDVTYSHQIFELVDRCLRSIHNPMRWSNADKTQIGTHAEHNRRPLTRGEIECIREQYLDAGWKRMTVLRNDANVFGIALSATDDEPMEYETKEHQIGWVHPAYIEGLSLPNGVPLAIEVSTAKLNKVQIPVYVRMMNPIVRCTTCHRIVRTGEMSVCSNPVHIQEKDSK